MQTRGLRRAIVHVGLPRTGTTTLQRVLFGLRPQLLAQGILYPDLAPRSATELHLSHQYLGEGLDGRRPGHERTELLDFLKSQLVTTQADTVLVSYEGLCLAPSWRDVPRRLAAFFHDSGFEMEVLVTLKPQAELVNSTYTWRSQFLREARRFDDYFPSEIGHPRLDLARLMRPWRAACAGRMRAVPMRDPRTTRPLVERIFDEIGILPRVAPLMQAGERTLVENRSPGPVAVEVCRQLRRRGAHLALGHAIRDATRFVEHAARDRGVNTVPFMGLDAPLQQCAVARWARANDQFAWQVWNEPWSARVADLGPQASNEVQSRATPGGECSHVDAIIQETCDRFGIRLAEGRRLAIHDALLVANAAVGRWIGYGRALAG